MAKFIIECPKCGRYAEAKTGFFAKKQIDCSCGNIIDVRTDKLASRTCPHCGNDIVFDQNKGAEAKCPVCGEPINTMAEQDKTIEFSCVQCGVRLRTSRAAERYTCPVCDAENDIQERLTSEKIKKDGLASIIKYEGDNDTLVWKHPIEDFNFGSQLIVHESQEAIFFRDGQALDLFGAGRYTLETQQLPLLEKSYKLMTDTEGTFHSEVYFINKTTQMSIKWGTSEKVRFIDPLTGVPLEIGASGELNLAVSDSRKLLIKLVGTMQGIAWDDRENFSKSIKSSFRPLITSAVKANLASVIKDNAIDLLEIDEHIDEISSKLLDKIVPGFSEYGLTIPQFYVTNVVLPEDDPNFKRIRDLHTITLQTRIYQAEATVKTSKAQSETMYRTAEEQSKAAIEQAKRLAELERQTTETEIKRREAERRVIEAQAEAQAKRMEGLTEAEIMRAKGYTEKDVLSAEVQKAYAEGIGNMEIGSGGSGGGGSVMGDMMSFGVGMAAMNNMMPQINNMMQGMNPQNQQDGSSAAGWTCPSCKKTGITSNFCPDCGASRMVPESGWTCPSCKKTGITSGFCPDCGAKKPEEAPGWDCPDCAMKNIKTNFCPNCGHKKGE